jgi:diguanylate cyclase (GGDEF)-like protein
VSIRLTINQVALAALVFAVVAIAAVSTIAVSSAHRLIALNEDVLRTQRLVASVESVRFHTLALESGEQTFVITGEDWALSAYKSSALEIDGELEFLRSKRAENAILARDLAALESAAMTYRASQARIIEARQQGGFAAAHGLTMARVGEGLRERSLGAAARLLNAFRRQQGAFEAEQIEHGDRIRRLILALISSSAIVLVLLYGSLRRLSNEQRRAEAKFRHQAMHDALTGLPNRYAVTEYLNVRLADRDAVAALGGLTLMLLDLDGFKAVNDRHGHAAGDDLLRKVAERLTRTLRDTDYVARLGGDEFLVVIPQVSDRETAALVAQKIIDAIGAPFVLDVGAEAKVGASIGIAFFPRDAAEREALQKYADAALYEAKEAGRNRLRFFHPDAVREPSPS